MAAAHEPLLHAWHEGQDVWRKQVDIALNNPSPSSTSTSRHRAHHGRCISSTSRNSLDISLVEVSETVYTKERRTFVAEIFGNHADPGGYRAPGARTSYSTAPSLGSRIRHTQVLYIVGSSSHLSRFVKNSPEKVEIKVTQGSNIQLARKRGKISEANSYFGINFTMI